MMEAMNDMIGGSQKAVQIALLLSPSQADSWFMRVQNIFQRLLLRITLNKYFGLYWTKKTEFYAVKSLWCCNDQYTSKSEISKDQITFSLCSSVITHVSRQTKSKVKRLKVSINENWYPSSLCHLSVSSHRHAGKSNQKAEGSWVMTVLSCGYKHSNTASLTLFTLNKLTTKHVIHNFKPPIS